MNSILTLCLYGLILTTTFAQQQLSVGDPAPPFIPLAWLKGDPIKEWNNQKIYVLEFGSTWCVPCAAAIPKLNQLSKDYGAHVEVISAFVMERNSSPDDEVPSYIEKVKKYINKKSMNFYVVVDDAQQTLEKQWLKASGRIGIPHIFLIDADGRIAWIGSNPDALKPAIDELIRNNKRVVKTGNRSMPTFRDNQNIIRAFQDTISASAIVKYTNPKQPNYAQPYIKVTAGELTGKDTYRHQVVGVELVKLFYMAHGDTLWYQLPTRNIRTLEFPDTIKNPLQKRSYGKYWHEPILEVSDISTFQERYNYSLTLPAKNISAAKIKKAMQADLADSFDYEVGVETRLMPYWKLVVQNENLLTKYRSTDQQRNFHFRELGEETFLLKNAEMRDVIWMLGSNFGFLDYDYGKLNKKDQAPFIDETGIHWKFDFRFSKYDTFEQFKAYLNSIGLDLQRKTKPMRVVVIKDKTT
ncbi:MAG: TlpA family protein disulfide reductase [Cyclobacteriaceae bacterium]|nr:TlpA family protein disulfide reductase [Cyclobacteriaceae bacterium]